MWANRREMMRARLMLSSEAALLIFRGMTSEQQWSECAYRSSVSSSKQNAASLSLSQVSRSAGSFADARLMSDESRRFPRRRASLATARNGRVPLSRPCRPRAVAPDSNRFLRFQSVTS